MQSLNMLSHVLHYGFPHVVDIAVTGVCAIAAVLHKWGDQFCGVHTCKISSKNPDTQ